MQIKLKKYHGLGNDYLVYDPRENTAELNEERVKLICHRNFGPGGDGILFGPILTDASIAVRIFNPDGSEAEKSGNGVRIFSKYLKDAGYVKDNSFILSTLGGDVKVDYLNADGTMIKALMGTVSFSSSEIGLTGLERQVVAEDFDFGGETYNATCVTIGNPHCVIKLPEISREKACTLGPLAENAPYFINRINVQLVRVIDECNIQAEIYERGAGYTLASGSSSCAAASAMYKQGFVGPHVAVHMPGGTLQIDIQEDQTVYMTGPVASVCEIILSGDFVKELLSK